MIGRPMLMSGLFLPILERLQKAIPSNPKLVRNDFQIWAMTIAAGKFGGEFLKDTDHRIDEKGSYHAYAKYC